ncbi:iron ABC transporter substrate-binding protein [Notoacmeibacter marinus]|uniref:Iron ABC transporter substrate-binding protein n=1 Tax=Notoacmeibacter marinus TaxID=1876515 RepID=A0A231V3T3_9HYPH|nr:extracellular solute-binding protein [Notoacmeibacter marinus]OXT02843.1 iron ABC transporter substrate-binding protein [Notoacmeibacter marinus]
MIAYAARLAAAATLVFSSGLLAPAQAADDTTVNIYSYRQPDLIKPVLDAFTKETGIETQVLFINKGLEERVQAEGENSPVDLILSTDISRLVNAKDMGITQPVESEELASAIPAEYRDEEGNWFGLTRRGRVIYASKERVDTDEMDYADLADEANRGRICIRDGQHSYNLGLFGSLIARWGEEKTEEWMEGLRDNLARRPDGNDRAQAQGIYSGECDLALGNTYYVGLMQTNEKEPEQQEWAKAIKVIFPTIGEYGTHVNISGMALAKHAPNAEAAKKLMTFLASDEAQRIYAGQVFEYPVKDSVPASDIVKGFGELDADDLPLSDVASHRRAASEMVDRVGLNQGPTN